MTSCLYFWLCVLQVELSLWDTAGQEDYDRLRPLSYPDADVALICYSVDSADSLLNVSEKWWPELRHFLPTVPLVVVGTKTDLRADEKTILALAERKEKPVPSCSGRDVAGRISAVAYRECSAKNNEGVREVFEAAARAALRYKPNKRRTCRLL